MRLGVVTAGLLLGLLGASRAHAETPLTAEDAVYAELGGPALLYSINYDRRFGNTAIRIGMGYLSASGSTTDYGPSAGYSAPSSLITAPLTVSRLFPGTTRNMFELGAGATLFRSRNFFSNTAEPTLSIVPTALAGFRSQSRRGGVVFRAGFAFLASSGKLDLGWDIVPWPYVAFGGAFE